MVDLTAIRTLAVALSYAPTPDAAGVSVAAYRGAGERGSRRGWSTATLLVGGSPRVDPMSYGYPSRYVHGVGADDAKALATLRNTLAARLLTSVTKQESLAVSEDKRAAEAHALASEHRAEAARLAEILAGVEVSSG